MGSLRIVTIRLRKEPWILAERAEKGSRATNLKRIALSAFGLLLLGYLLSRLDFWALMQAFVCVSPGTIIEACLMQLLIMLLKWIRWRSILRIGGIKLPIARDCLTFLSSLAIGIGTPGQIGEVSRAYFLRREIGTTYMHGISLVFVDRLNDLFFLGVFGLTALVVLQIGFITTIIGVIGLVVTAVVICVWAWSSGKLFIIFLQSLMSMFRMKPGKKCRRFTAYIDMCSPHNMAKPIFLTVLAQLIAYGQVLVVAYGFSLPKPVYELLPIIALANIASVLPISVAGLGTREAVYLYFIGQGGQWYDRTMAFSLTTFSVSYLLSSLIGIFAWQVYARSAFTLRLPR